MYKKLIALAMAIFLSISILSGCNNGTENETSESGDATGAVNTSNTEVIGTADSSASIDIEFTSRDLDIGYDETTATIITLNNSASVSGNGASASGSTVTISDEGTYVISGSLDDGQILVDAENTDKIQVVLKGVDINCYNSAAIYVKQADKVFILLEENTLNTLSGGSEYVQTDDNNVDAVIFSKDDLTINGNGSLNINANYKHAIVSKDDLVITGGNITVNAVNGGLYGKDCVKIKDGTFALTTGADGIQASNTEDTVKGYVYICGGTFNINAGTDGMQAETVLRIDGGTFNITTGGGSANASTDSSGSQNSRWGNWGAQDTSETNSTSSAKGVKTGSELIINGGTFTIDSSDDAVHSNGNITMAGGNITANSGDDGFHADSALLIENGTIDIQKSFEGIEGCSVTVNGGEISIVASDDGINSGGGSDTAAQGRPGQNTFSQNSDIFIKITGGTTIIDASGDGVDSNANFYMDGGILYVSGPTDSGNGAFDYDGTAGITGGTVVAVGSSGMALGFSNSSSQCSILYNFSTNFSAGTEVALKGSNGDVLISYVPEKGYQSVVISSPDIVQGQVYTLTCGSESVEIEMASTTISNGSSGFGGMGGSQQPGGAQPGGGGGGKAGGGRMMG